MKIISKKQIIALISCVLCIALALTCTIISFSEETPKPMVEVSSAENVIPSETIEIYLTAHNFNYVHSARGGYQFYLDIPDIATVKSVSLNGSALTAPNSSGKEAQYNIASGNTLIIAGTFNYTENDILEDKAIWTIVLDIAAHASNGQYPITYLDSSKLVGADFEEVELSVETAYITVNKSVEPIPGDADSNKVLNSDDLSAIRQYILNGKAIDKIAADLNNDTVIDICDLVSASLLVKMADVYVDASGTSAIALSGESNVYASLNDALYYVSNGGTVHIVGSYIASSSEFVWNTHNKTLTVTGDTLDFSDFSTLNIRDNVTFKDINLVLKQSGTVNFCGNEVAIDEHVIDDYAVTCYDGAYTPEYSYGYTDWDGPSGYRIVYAEGNAYNRVVAEYLQDFFYSMDEIQLEVVTDATAEQEREILVGDTNRRTTNLSEKEFAVILEANKLVFEGGHRVMVEKAAKWFMTLERSSGKVATLNGNVDNFASTLTGELSGYTYVWGDEFDGNFLDETKFKKSYHMGQVDQLATLSDNEKVFGISNGEMRMSAITYSDPNNPNIKYATSMPICTDETMWWNYGYAEMRVKIPFSHGAWPAWWATDYCQSNRSTTNDKGWQYQTEIDIFEVFGENRQISTTLHKWFDSKNIVWNETMHNKGYDVISNSKKVDILSASLENKYQYHTIGFLWTPDEITMSFDGREYYTLDMNSTFAEGFIESLADTTNMDGFKRPVHMILDNWLYVDSNEPYDGYKVNPVDDMPVDMCVDYIRLYQKSDIAGTYLDNRGITQ